MAALLGSKSLPPGFRFHPTDEELFMFYLKRKVMGKSLGHQMMSEVDVFRFAPWDLPAQACLKTRDLNWFFLCPRSKMHPNGGRANRASVYGFWKSTGNDRTVNYQNRPVGKIKTLIFHRGKPPKGDRTDWVMHEYRLDDRMLVEQRVAQDSYVICKIYEKSGLGPKNGESYGAPFVEEEWDSDIDDNDHGLALSPQQPLPVSVAFTQNNSVITSSPAGHNSAGSSTPSTVQQPSCVAMGELQPIETEEDEIGRLLAMLTDGDGSAGHNSAGSSTPSTVQQPSCVAMGELPPIETEEDEIGRLLAMLTDGDGSDVPMTEDEIFNGLEDFAGGSLNLEECLDLSHYLSDDCYMELKDLED